ncbi:MAG: hypothetical protein QMD09_00525 [Desulfatibacillaceae bacterium]|nr:hypothetical protein [Desulfatibacillaceae bacterium]
MRLFASALLPVFLALALAAPGNSLARTKLFALPERGAVSIVMDQPGIALVEEERVLSLQQGINQVDFSWGGVMLDPDSIRIAVINPPQAATLLKVSYPPGESALIWDIAASKAARVTIVISYILNYLDRLAAYQGLVNQGETLLELSSFFVIRNFSGESFSPAQVSMPPAGEISLDLVHGQTTRHLAWRTASIPIEKVWIFDAASHPWERSQAPDAGGLPVSYRIVNNRASNLGVWPLLPGKIRIFGQDGKGESLFLGESSLNLTPLEEPALVSIGQSRDVVVTQNKMRQTRVNERKNTRGRVVLYDTDEIIEAKIENFKDQPAVVMLYQHIPGQWQLVNSSLDFSRKNANTLEYEVRLAAGQAKNLVLHYQRKNVRN